MKCDYCYVSQYDQKYGNNVSHQIEFNYTPEHVKKALSVERLGGVCHFNLCANGETLIPSNLINYVKVILENGHSVMIVTNGTLTARIKEYISLPAELRARLGFKISFHFLELKRLNLMEVFFNNIKMIREAGCSFSLELTANDGYEPYIDEIKELCMKHVGALCHLSVPRDEPEKNIPLLSKHTLEEFYEIWKDFDSPMFDNKIKFWGQKRKEYCYAGAVTGLLNLKTGDFSPCYRQHYTQNIFKNLKKPIIWCPVGKCNLPHCFNGHSFLAFGTIPELDFCTYEQVRDRIDINGNHWLTPEMREHLGAKFVIEPLKGFNKFGVVLKKNRLFLNAVKNKLLKRK